MRFTGAVLGKCCVLPGRLLAEGVNSTSGFSKSSFQAAVSVQLITSLVSRLFSTSPSAKSLFA